MSFPTQYIPSEPTPDGVRPGPGPGGPGSVVPPPQESVEFMDPVPGDAVAMLGQTRRSVAFFGVVLLTLGLLVTLPATTFAVLKWETDHPLARQLVMAAAAGFLWLIPACYLRVYARRIKRLIDFPTGDLLSSALAAQRGFWRTANALLAVVLMTAAGLGGKFVWSTGVRTVSNDVRSRVMAFAAEPVWTPGVLPPADLPPAAATPAAPTPVNPIPAVVTPSVAAPQPIATEPAATQPAAPARAVAATPAEPTPPSEPIPSDQASVEPGESPATHR